MNMLTLPISLKKRGDGPYDIHPQYGQLYKRMTSTEYDYVIVQGQLYWLDDEDLVQVGWTTSIEISIEVVQPLSRRRIAPVIGQSSMQTSTASTLGKSL